MEDIYEFELSSVTHLVTMTSKFDDVLFLEGQIQGKYIDRFMLRTITKTQPEFRYTIINKNSLNSYLYYKDCI